MGAELDHVFILCSAGAPEARALTQLGFREGSPNTHPGQGTACRRFFFRTSYVELAWVHDSAEAQSEAVRRVGLWDRWSRRRQDASPFGIALRPGRDATETRPPFPTWSYRPAYLPETTSIQVASDVPLMEPAFFWLPYRRGGPGRDEPSVHPLGQTMTDLRIGAPVEGPFSEPVRFAEAGGLLVLETDEEHVLDLTLDDAPRGEVLDLRPVLPLRLRR